MESIDPLDNPLRLAVLDLLRQQAAPVSEHQLMSALTEELDALLGPDTGDDLNLRLFRKHFLLMNALYQLQCSLAEEGVWLAISALSISLGPRPPARASEEGALTRAGDESLRQYYLDWHHFQQADAESVAELLASFWLRYRGQDRQQQALEWLQLEALPSAEELTAAYRRLAARHHPDRGGDAARFVEIREAYELLRHVV
ncbi:DNA-J related domain-containing protein [Aestuariirhabdus litorea]|uniref:Molecular chaperone n=1 Tax=Aestuariirhabdus litorea TaxID=2528527 RepID=A0A3P3VJA6_9GAMM|nr:DNA-J related domain-containing protein [Aestuariirhabdus litorea]RRJ82762.1 molecular chaperone [Aestuariirhabdus litorea]RWW92923.1 molecular chaperone [Endozoicomonadaceae bacterium GTF-13]